MGSNLSGVQTAQELDIKKDDARAMIVGCPPFPGPAVMGVLDNFVH